MNDYLSVIRLGYGKGQPGQQACWMTALQSHLGGQWTDQCECVDPVINSLCIRINDLYGSDDAARTEDVLAFGLFRPIGTRGTRDDTMKRMWFLIDLSIRTWAPITLRLCKREDLAVRLESLPQVTAETINEVREVTKAVRKAADAAAAAAAAADAAAAAYAAAYAAADAAAAARRKFIKEHLFPALDKLIEMGPHSPDEPTAPACGVPEFHRLVGVGH